MEWETLFERAKAYDVTLESIESTLDVRRNG